MRKTLILTAAALLLCGCITTAISAQEMEDSGLTENNITDTVQDTDEEEGIMPVASQPVIIRGNYTPYENAKYTLSYGIDNEGVVIAGYDVKQGLTENIEEIGELVIPSEIEGASVYKINDSAFTIWMQVNEDGTTSYRGGTFTGNLVLPEGLKVIGNGAFSGQDALTGDVALPDQLLEIGERAFRNCSGITNIKMPDSLSTIGNKAFEGCSSLTEIILPRNLDNLGEDVFVGCSSLKAITLPLKQTMIDCSMFNSQLQEIIFPDGIGKIELKNTTYLDSGYKKVKLHIPASVADIQIERIEYHRDKYAVCGERGSAAEKWAEDNRLPFIPEKEEVQKEVIVGTAEELLNAIGSSRRVILKDGVYILSDTLDITGQALLTLEAEHDGMAEILVKNRYKPVISITNSIDVEVKGCILGHDSVGITDCGEGAYVIAAYQSESIKIETCDLYGCGIEGIHYYEVAGFNIENCVIRDCKTYIIYDPLSFVYSTVPEGGDIHISDCVISGNNSALQSGSFMVGEYEGILAIEAVFENCVFLNNYNYSLQKDDGVVLDHCSFYDNVWDGKTPKAYGICLNGITWQVTDDVLKIGYPLVMEDGTTIESAKGRVLNYSESSLPWKDYMDKKTVVADDVIYSAGSTDNPNPDEDKDSMVGDLTLSNGKYYFYEDGEMAVSKEAFVNGAWRWFDADGSMAADKDVYQTSSGGKWVRYNENGEMIKGEDYRYGGWYYFEPITGTMMKGPVTLEDGRKVFYDTVTGQMLRGEHVINGQSYQFDEGDGHLLSGQDTNFWVNSDGKDFWYEGWQRQGWDPADESYRGKEIYDPASDAWYWLDNVQHGAKAIDKDVYQESYSAYPDREDGTGKWVRYDANGHMVKGWQTTEAGTCYFEEITGAMAKGSVTIDGIEYYFDPVTGIRQD